MFGSVLQLCETDDQNRHLIDETFLSKFFVKASREQNHKLKKILNQRKRKEKSLFQASLRNLRKK